MRPQALRLNHAARDPRLPWHAAGAVTGSSRQGPGRPRVCCCCSGPRPGHSRGWACGGGGGAVSPEQACSLQQPHLPASGRAAWHQLRQRPLHRESPAGGADSVKLYHMKQPGPAVLAESPALWGPVLDRAAAPPALGEALGGAASGARRHSDPSVRVPPRPLSRQGDRSRGGSRRQLHGRGCQTPAEDQWGLSDQQVSPVTRHTAEGGIVTHTSAPSATLHTPACRPEAYLGVTDSGGLGV